MLHISHPGSKLPYGRVPQSLRPNERGEMLHGLCPPGTQTDWMRAGFKNSRDVGKIIEQIAVTHMETAFFQQSIHRIDGIRVPRVNRFKCRKKQEIFISHLMEGHTSFRIHHSSHFG